MGRTRTWISDTQGSESRYFSLSCICPGLLISSPQDDTGDGDGGGRKRSSDLALDNLFAKKAKLEEEERSWSAPNGEDAPKFVKPSAIASVAPTPVSLASLSANLPPGWSVAFDLGARPYYYHNVTRIRLWKPPTDEQHAQAEAAAFAQRKKQEASFDVNDIVERVRREAEAAAAAAAQASGSGSAVKAERKKPKKKPKEVPKEKKMMRLFSAVVVRTMSKYKTYLDTEQFKKRAKEVRCPNLGFRGLGFLIICF